MYIRTRNSGPPRWKPGPNSAGLASARTRPQTPAPHKARTQGTNTTLAIVATDADLTQAQANRLATAAHDGLARALFPAHTLLDGDLIFAAASGDVALPADPLPALVDLGHAAATCLARAVARGVFQASPQPGDILPCWRSLVDLPG